MAGFNKASTKKLFAAVNRNNAKAISGLVEGGADPNAQSKDFTLSFGTPKGATPLTLAACVSRPDVLDALIKAGADPNLEAKGAGMTPLMCCGFNSANLKKLVRIGADPDATAGSRKETALHYFIRWSMESACRELIKAGADPSVTNKNGVSATDFAFNEGYDELHALFLKAQKKPRSKSAAKSTSGPANDDFIEALANGTAARVKKLVKAGCDPNADLSGYSPLDLCVRHDNVAAAKALIELGASADGLSLSECNPESKILKLLLENGADPNSTSAAVSLLMHSVERGYSTAVRLLVTREGTR